MEYKNSNMWPTAHYSVDTEKHEIHTRYPTHMLSQQDFCMLVINIYLVLQDRVHHKKIPIFVSLQNFTTAKLSAIICPEI